MSEHILIIEDDPRLCEMLSEYLAKAGYAVTAHMRAKPALAWLAENPVGAIILDLMLPDMDGLEVCRQLRASSDIPVLMLTARGDAIDRIIGLELGADDYLPKPFEPRELLARLRAVLRRGGEKQRATQEVLRFGRLEIEPVSYAARLDGKACDLTTCQFDLLVLLARNAGRVMSREALLDATSGSQGDTFDRSIDVHMSRLRAAVEDDPKHPRRIITVRGAGYVFAKDQD
ncbi:response regulator transcription factor [Pseudoduganella namucuonensis]|uniref:DNA-binding response regulator, OmpR family, contains REC and winged-helix (WHTH) domain n=1 Tax=Pseudoduganella namucuonensis TaxID=1035707 RepID=A0A1I7JMG8_9BURK|nr:response regulator transcription factor [Pseudoduganella namucuonensis]SFU86384.1 DNA-binding response regulator, OmpR family, contains REC and winged-helix (wHTH) domain [Pseudoduganella namucuonensis]